MFSAAIFDMDGLLIDSERAIMRLWLRATAELGRPLTDDEYVPIIGRAALESAALMTEVLGRKIFEQAAAQVRELALTADPAELFPTKPGAREILERLSELGIPCAVASSTAAGEVRRRLSAVGLLHFFAIVVGGNQVPKGKPDPALYNLAVAELGVGSASCLAFEDSDNGVAAAAAASVHVVMIPDLKAPNDMSAARSFEILASLVEARPRIDSWFATAARTRAS